MTRILIDAIVEGSPFCWIGKKDSEASSLDPFLVKLENHWRKRHEQSKGC